MTPTIDCERALATAERANKKTARDVAEKDRHRLGVVERLLAEFDRRPQGEVLERLLRAGVHVSADRVKHVYGRMSDKEIRHLLKRELVLEQGRLVPAMRGGVVGMAPTNFRNAPQGVRGKDWDIAPDQFYPLTVRNEQLVAQPSKASGWDVASFLDFPLSKRGILHELALVFTGTMTITPGTGSFTQGWKWPWGIPWHIALQAGGESSLQYGTGNDFRTRTERLYRNPPTGSTGGAGGGVSAGSVAGTLASGANTIKVILPIPVAHDMRTGIGSIFRPADDLQLTLHIDNPNMAELIALTGNATAVWTNVNVQLAETYMRVVRNDQGMIVLPDISRVFMTTIEENYFSNNGPVPAAIPRQPGVLLSISEVLDQGATIIAPSALSDVRFTYGENQQPVFMLPDRILERNRRDYNGLLHGGSYFAIDGEVDNPQRDVWIPRNFIEGNLVADIPGTITPLANSRAHLFLESLVQANLT